MGLFSFIKNAGAKVFGIGKTDAEKAAEAAAEELREEALVARRMEGTIRDLGLDVDGLNVHVDDDMARMHEMSALFTCASPCLPASRQTTHSVLDASSISSANTSCSRV